MAQDQGDSIAAVVCEMAKDAGAGCIAFPSGGKSDAKRQRTDCRADFADAVGGMPDRKPRLSRAQRPVHRQGSFLEGILLAIEIGQSIIHIGHRAAGVGKGLFEGLDHAIGAQGFFKLDGRGLVTGADTYTNQIVGVRLWRADKYGGGGFAWNKAIGILAG